jgi:uncharacterized protein (TIGR02996 family)
MAKVKARTKSAAKRTKAKAAKAPPAVDHALLAQILANPDDRALRVVYADALSDAGDPRGAFITQQCALAELDPLDERYAPMLASTNRLAAAHAKQWLAGYDPEIWPGVVDRLWNAQFESGFLKRIAMPPEAIAKAWPMLRAREPVEGVELVVGDWLDHTCRQLAEPKQFRVLKIKTTGWFTSNSLGNVLAWGMPALRELDIAGCDIGETGARLLANLDTDLGEHFPDYVAPPPFAPGQLRVLGLAGTNIGDAGARLLFAAPHLAEIEALDLGRCRIVEAATLGALRDAETTSRLRRLSLAGNNELGSDLGVLAGWADRLVELKLPQSTTPAALQALFPKPSAALRTLELASAKELRAARIEDVAEALAHLDIGTTGIGDDRFRELIGATSARRLVHLHANGCSLSDAAIARMPLERLVSLDLSSNKLTDAGMQTLAGWSGLAHVTFLRVGNNRKVTAAGLDALAKAAQFQPAEFDIGKVTDKKLVAKLRERFGDALVARE